MNVVSGYTPQVCCEMKETEENEKFWSELNEMLERNPRDEREVIVADFNGHVVEGNIRDEDIMGSFGVKDFAKKMEMAMVNSYLQKREEHRGHKGWRG